MYVLAWRTVYALTRGLFWCLFPELCSNEGYKHQNNTRVSAWTAPHKSTYIILFLTRHNESINDAKNEDLHTSSRVSFSVSKTFYNFPRTLVRVSKMNAVARAQLTYQMLTLLKKYLYCQSQCSKTWDSKCLALIAQQVRAFGINPKLWGSSPPQDETFSVSTICVCRKWMLFPAHS